jgi:hypothetical protein
MATVRLGQPAIVLGTQPDPTAPNRATGQIREADEALLVTVRGLAGGGPRRTSGGSLTLTLNDGSGELRVFVASATGITAASLPRGSWVEIRGVVGQQTTGSAPSAGYRLWPRDRDDVRLVASALTTASPRTATVLATADTPAGADGAGAAAAPAGIRPRLGGVLAHATDGFAAIDGDHASVPRPTELQAPLAISLGGLAGLATLAWRHGTWRRLHGEVMERVALRSARLRTGAHGERADESYTLAP